MASDWSDDGLSETRLQRIHGRGDCIHWMIMKIVMIFSYLIFKLVARTVPGNDDDNEYTIN